MVSLTPSDEKHPIRWGIVGPGTIAGVFADACTASGAGEIRMVLGRNPERADEFAARYGATRVGELKDLLNRRAIDAVYIATPHPMHAHYAEQALQARIGVLCEKPLTISASETASLIELSKERGTLLVEGWMYRTHPQIEEACRLIRSGVLGKVHSVNACFGVSCAQQLPERVLSPELAGGVIYDIGGYPLSAALLIDGVTGGQCSIESLTLTHQSCTSRGVELDARCSIRFTSGLSANLACSFEENLGLSIQVVGDRGTLMIPNAFLPEGRRDGKRGVIELSTIDRIQTLRVDAEQCCFGLEAMAFGRLFRRGRIEAEMPMVGCRESLQIAEALDMWKSRIVCESTHAMPKDA